MKPTTLLVFVFCMFLACKPQKETKEEDIEKPMVYTEAYRPQYHFSPPEKWMNDPNGLVYYEGIYHLFYQYYPEDIVWGPMHWGHAVSQDMMHWEHKPIALYPDEHGLIFSGSAVVDHTNSSGFGENGEIPMVAMFTYHLMEGEKSGRSDFQTQGIAFSLDKGETWAKYDGNPVIKNPGIRDFRDPKVFWHKETQQWIMALVAGNHAKFYSSNNLKDWKHLSDFGKKQGAHGGVWECPDLFPLKVEGEEEEKWILIISINPGAPNGGSGTQYFVGEFDGKRFTSSQKEAKWLDYGTDNYAGVTYNNTPKNERIFLGWMSNWDYARDTPTTKWRSAMTVPRTLKLRKIEGEYFLTNYPLKAVGDMAKGVAVRKDMLVPLEKETFYVEDLQQSQLEFDAMSKDFKLTFKNGKGDFLELVSNRETNAFLLNRMSSGQVDFQSEFGNKKHFMPLDKLDENGFKVRVLMDWSSIEVFLENGLYTMTQQVFPREPYNQLLIENLSETASMENILIERMPSVW